MEENTEDELRAVASLVREVDCFFVALTGRHRPGPLLLLAKLAPKQQIVNY